jgi:hypothetical protein
LGNGQFRWLRSSNPVSTNAYAGHQKRKPIRFQ